MINVSTVDNDSTARTCPECAAQRAENLAALGARSVLELCCGPSLKTLEDAYKKYGIKVTGNDIDFRWKNYYRKGRWLICDAMAIDTSEFDAIVFAPPLSRGCTGKREDSLSALEVTPSYSDFIKKGVGARITVMVLPGRLLATAKDRQQYHHLLSRLDIKKHFDLMPLTSGRRKTIKYYDLVIY